MNKNLGLNLDVGGYIYLSLAPRDVALSRAK